MRLLAAIALTASVAHAQPDGGASGDPIAWSKLRAPSSGSARAIGGYSAGCLAGAVALPVRGDGFRVARPERNRLFGHPLLIEVVRALGRAVAKLGLPA